MGAADSQENLSHAGSGDSIKKKFGYNFIAEDFQGVSLHRTICLECEEVSELKEPFLEIQASFFSILFFVLFVIIGRYIIFNLAALQYEV